MMTCNDHEWFLQNGYISKGVYPYFQPGPSPIRSEQDLNLSSGFVEVSYVGVLTTTPGRQCAGVPNTTHGARTKCTQQNENTGTF